jgi:hypothetical protein
MYFVQIIFFPKSSQKKNQTNPLSVKVLLILRQSHGRSAVSDQQFMVVLQLLR